MTKHVCRVGFHLRTWGWASVLRTMHIMKICHSHQQFHAACSADRQHVPEVA